MTDGGSAPGSKSSSPVGRGGVGTYIEGELGAFYLLAMLAGGEARGLPTGAIERVRFQGADQGFALDDLIVHVASRAGSALLEIQSKRTVKFSPKETVFNEICKQIANVRPVENVDEDRHLLAVATQRTSYRIAGPYQDVLDWARNADTAKLFFDRLDVPGLASPEMREFVASFRANLVKHGVADDDEVIWRLMRRFQILEFDFEASAPLARTHALSVAQAALAPADSGRAWGLWSSLIDIALETAKAGGGIDRATLRELILKRGFRLAGNRNFATARERLKEKARFALADIGTSVGGLSLPRLPIVAAVDDAREDSRIVEIRGGPGAGKSGVFRHIAERTARESHIMVLDPVRTPGGGWNSLATGLGIDGTARDFLTDLASSGGAVLFIDSIDMFTAPEKQRTVNDVLREASQIDGFSVLVTARTGFGRDGENWLAADALERLGPPQQVDVPDLDDAEVAILSAHAPELRALLAPGHPAEKIARNLYRLSRLLKVPNAAAIRTEAALALNWWTTGDGAPGQDVRAAQRLLAALADAALAGQDNIHVTEDSAARTYLLGTLTLREVKRDHLAFYHDVLRDWAVGIRLDEEAKLVDTLDLSRPAPPDIARGIEFAGRLALERAGNGDWEVLLTTFSPQGAHGSWRRNALVAIMRSELAPTLVEGRSALLLQRGGTVLNELTNAIVATETVPTADLLEAIVTEGESRPTILSRSLRSAITGSARRLLAWCVRHAAEMPIQAIPAVTKLVEIQTPLQLFSPSLAGSVPAMLFDWLIQLDIRESDVSIPRDENAEPLDSSARSRLVADLRTLSLMHAACAPEQTKVYLTGLAAEKDSYKVKVVRPMSPTLAAAAPAELAHLIEATLIAPPDRGRSSNWRRDDAFTHADTDYMPASPAQQPFLAMLRAAPEIGLGLIRRLTDHGIAHYSGGKTPVDNGFRLEFDKGSRFFPWRDAYLWSRGQGNDYAVASGLMALEAWGHERLDAGENIEAVLADILGPDGSSTAYLMIAVDLLISHWPATRDALAPFVSSPGLLAAERQRQAFDQMGHGFFMGEEPTGEVRLEHLRQKPSRRINLEDLVTGYLGTDNVSGKVRDRLTRAVAELGPYDDHDDFASPPFIGAHALNLLDPDNWVAGQNGPAYRPPPAEIEHLAKLAERRSNLIHSSTIEAKINLATSDRGKGSAELAKEAVEHAAGDLPDDTDTDHLKSRSTRLVAIALLAVRDGDDTLLDTHEQWIRQVIARALKEKIDRYGGSVDRIDYNRPALATCALIHLWHRRRQQADRDAVLNTATRDDRAAPLAFAAAMPELLKTDPRVVKAAVRIGFAAARYRWHPWDEEPSETEAYAREKAAHDAESVAAEIAWLAEGPEPDWPQFPEEAPLLRRRSRISIPSGLAEDADQNIEDVRDAKPVATVHAHTQAAAAWLRTLDRNPEARFSWVADLILTYADWSARMNGYGLSSITEIDRPPSEWNDEFYALSAPVMMTATEQDFERLLGLIVGLPDKSFGDVMEAVLHAADVWYFNDPDHSADRPVRLRAAGVERARELLRWRANYRPGDLSIDHDTGGIAAKLFMNTHNPFAGTKSYLVPPIFDRIDPLIETLRPLLTGGPTAFVALCTMNMLIVAPRARHAEFLLTAAEEWLKRLQNDATMWIELGIGRRIVEWFQSASTDDPTLLTPAHQLRPRIDTLIGRMVSFGIPEAHELEQRI